MISQSVYPYSPRKSACSSLEVFLSTEERRSLSALAPRSTVDKISVQRHQADQGDVPTPEQKLLTLPSPIIARRQTYAPVLSRDYEVEDFSQTKPELDHCSRTTEKTITVARIPESKNRTLPFAIDRSGTPLKLSSPDFSSDNNSQHCFTPTSTPSNRKSYLSANSVLFQPPKCLPLLFAATAPIHHPGPQRVDRIPNALPDLDYTAERVSFLTDIANRRRDSILHMLDVAGLEIEDDPVAMKELYEYSTMGIEGSSAEEHTLALINSALLPKRE